MKEATLLLFLISGQLKCFLLAYGIELPVDLTLLTAVLVTAVAAVEFMTKPDFKNLVNRHRVMPMIAICIFYLWMIITLSFTPSEKYAYTKCFYFLTNILAFGVLFVSPSFRFIRFRNLLIAVSVIMSIFFLLAFPDYWLSTPSVFGIRDFECFKLLYLPLGFLLGMSIILSLGIRDEIKKIVLINFLLLLLAGTASRGPLIFTLFVLFLAVILMIRTIFSFIRHHTKRFVYLMIFILVFDSAYFLVAMNNEKLSVNYERSFARFLVLFGIDTGTGMQNTSVEVRVGHIKYAWEKITESPATFMKGYGIGSYGLMKEGTDKRLYPHNMFLEILFEMGLLGMIFFLWYLYYIGKSIRGKPLFILLLMIYLLLNLAKSFSLVDLRFFFAIFGFVLYLPLSLFTSPKRKHV